MSKITAKMLRDMVGITRGRPLIDQLIDPLNLVLPEYSIDTEYEVCAFLATCAPESDWFKTLREYGKGAGRKYGKAINGLIYYGRGIFQVTWLKNYQSFTEYVIKHWAKIKGRAVKYGYTEAPNFVLNPELLATPYWAVEAACWYWKINDLGTHANKGLKGFFALQGLVNRGNATKKALHYEARLNSYEIARRVFPDDFSLGTSGQVIDVEHKVVENDTEDTIAATETIRSDEKETALGKETLTTTEKNEQDVTIPAEVTSPTPYNDIGFVATIKKDLAAIGGGNLSFAGLSEYATQASGWPPWVVSILTKVAVLVAVLSVVWILVRLVHFGIDTWKKNKKIDREVLISTDVSRKDFTYVEAPAPVAPGSWIKAILPTLRKQPESVVTMEESK